MKAAMRRTGHVGRRQAATDLCFDASMLGVGAFVFVCAVLSFTTFSPVRHLAASTPFSLQNYEVLLNDTVFWTACLRSLLLALAITPIHLLLATILAVALVEAPRLRTISIAILVIPPLAPPSAVGLLSKLFFTHDVGLGADLLAYVYPQGPLVTPVGAITAFLLVDTWYSVPLLSIFLFVQLRAIPSHVWDVTRLYGRTFATRLRWVYVPSILQFLGFLVMFRILDFLRHLEIPFVLTGGGPGNATEVVGTYVYRQTFLFWEFAYGCALSIVWCALIVGVWAALARTWRVRYA